MGTTLQRPTPDTLESFVTAAIRGFLTDLSDEDLPGFRDYLNPLDRYLGFTDGRGDWVATAGAIPYQMALPGGTRAGCAGVTLVTVRSDHRRQGLLTQMMGTMFDDAREAGEPFAALLASEGPIYGRFGFGLSAPSATLEVDRSHAVPAEPGDATRVELVDVERARAEFPPLYDAVVDRHPGCMSASDAYWDAVLLHDTAHDRRGYSKRRHALVPGKGFAVYRTKDSWDGRVGAGRLKVQLLVAADDQTYRDLLTYLASVDLVKTISLFNRPVDDALPFLLPDENRIRPRAELPLWLRLVDLPGALTARSYDVADRLVMDVSDRFLPDNAGVWSLTVGPDGAECVRTGDAPDLRCDVSDLGSVVLDGYRATTLRSAGRLQELTPGAVSRLGRMMRADTAPWCAIQF